MKKALTSLLGNRRGAVIPIFGMMVIILVVIAGAAIDISRVVNAREKLSYAIDAAALSVATDLSTSVLTNAEITQRIEDSFRANLADAEFLDKAIENVDFNIDSENGVITISSTATLENYFLDMGGYGIRQFGPETFSFGTSAQVNFSRFDVELALVVDVTGSMWRYMSALRTASQSVVDILIPSGTKEADSKVKISLIPYSEGVNLGPYAQKVANGAQGTQNCVTERLGAAQYTDAAHDYDSTNSESYFGGGSKGCAPSPQLQPLTAKRQMLTSAVSKLAASGGTAGQTGVAWGWYTLSPNWADLWPKASTPSDYNSEDILKFAIIMTDGDFNRYYYKRRLSKSDCRYYARWYITETCRNGRNDYWFPAGSGGFNGQSSQRAMELCDGMKDAGITIYSVYFGSNNNSAPARVMKDCASKTSTYINASSSNELIQAFANIAKNIQKIYLSK